MWWKGIIWPPTSSSWKAIPRAACLSGLITSSLLKIPQCSLLNPPPGRAPAQLFPPWREAGAPAQLCAGLVQEHLLCGAVLELFAVEIALVEGLEGLGSPPSSASSPDSLWPPCLVIYLQLNSAGGRGQVFHLDKKKRALLKGTDLSITLFCRHGAFIAFLSTNPFPFLNHNNSPPPLLHPPWRLGGSSLFPQTPALLPSSLTVLVAPGRSWNELWSISRAGRCWVSLCAGLGALGMDFLSSGKRELRDFMALVLLEHLFYRESGCSFVEQGVQCLCSDLKSVWKWKIILWSPAVVGTEAVQRPKAVALRG